MTVSRARAERGLRGYRQRFVVADVRAFICGVPQRQGDEMACRCGKRWPIGEDHP